MKNTDRVVAVLLNRVALLIFSSRHVVFRVFPLGVPASEIMVEQFPYVTMQSTCGDVTQLLAQSAWSVCAFLSNEEERQLLGVIPRHILQMALEVCYVHCIIQLNAYRQRRG